jgi:hypothetical protein
MNMNKADCLEKAQAARHASKVAQARAAIYARAFGGDDELTQQAFLDADVAIDAARLWEKVATWHPQTRSKALRELALPRFIFGY